MVGVSNYSDLRWGAPKSVTGRLAQLLFAIAATTLIGRHPSAVFWSLEVFWIGTTLDTLRGVGNVLVLMVRLTRCKSRGSRGPLACFIILTLISSSPVDPGGLHCIESFSDIWHSNTSKSERQIRLGGTKWMYIMCQWINVRSFHFLYNFINASYILPIQWIRHFLVLCKKKKYLQ